MKAIQFLSVFLLLTVASCNSVKVYSDYDGKVDFSKYKTYAFHKNGIDKVAISELDKKRILYAIDAELAKKGMTKSENPDLLINIFTKEREQINVNQYNAGLGYGWGYGWNPYVWGGRSTSFTSSIEGTLYIDLIDANKKELVWQGEGIGYLTNNRNEKEKVITQFVTRILEQFPPSTVKK